MVDKVLFSSKVSEWKTPIWLFKKLESMFGKFDLDPATSEDNPLSTPYFYTPREDGLKQKWFGRVYVNPPYGRRVVYSWVSKAVYECVIKKNCDLVVMLLPARTDTLWFQNLVLKYASEIYFIRGRIKFVGAKNTAPFPSIIVVFKKDKKDLDPPVIKRWI